jgi:hypothetical protein
MPHFPLRDVMSISSLISDPYERTARLTPALLVILPVLVPLVCVYGPKNPTLTALVALLSSCGVLYVLSSVARGRGKKLQEKLVEKWGGLPSTIALRHRDTSFDVVSKRRYHEYIRTKLRIGMPTPEDEARNPVEADEIYIGAGRRIRELTRGERKLLLKENIAYGFHRNMLAMKSAGIASSLLGIAYGAVISKALSLHPLAVSLAELTTPGLAGGMTLAISLMLLAVWSLYFDEDKVRRIGFSYAERLFECLASLPEEGGKSRTRSKTSSTKAENDSKV